MGIADSASGFFPHPFPVFTSFQVTESLHKTIVKRRMSHVSGGGSIDLSDTDSLQEWINMTGFLCALGGVCLQHRSSAGFATYSPPMGPVSERKGSMISMMSTEGNTETPVSKFMDRLLSLMVCTHEKVGLQIRTNIKDLMGLELSPALYPMLFNKLKSIISKFFDSQGQVRQLIDSVAWWMHEGAFCSSCVDAVGNSPPPCFSVTQVMLGM